VQWTVRSRGATPHRPTEEPISWFEKILGVPAANAIFENTLHDHLFRDDEFAQSGEQNSCRRLARDSTGHN
jgi:hypothetical protein